LIGLEERKRIDMFTPIGYFAPTGGGGNPIPVSGYVFHIDLAQESTLTLDGSLITSLTDVDGLYTFTNNGTKPLWNSAGYIDGTGSSTGWGLIENSNAIAAELNSNPIASNPYTLVIVTNESPSRSFPFGMRTTSGGGNGGRWDTFYNDSAGRRDIVYGGQTFVSGITNDVTKDTVIFQNIAGGNRILYRWGTTESQSTTDAVGSVNTDADFTKIGITARFSNLPSPGFNGKIYTIALYRKTLTSQEREDIKDWAVSKYSLTLQS
jgi:hypothetical protein